MKALTCILAFSVAMISGVLADDAKLAELESRISNLELQNQTLRQIIERLSGRSIDQILADPPIQSARPATPAPAVTPAPAMPETVASAAPEPPRGPTPEQLAAMAAVKAEIKAIEDKWDPKRLAAMPKPKIPTAKADIEKARQLDMEKLSELRLRLARMEAIVSRQ